MEEALKVLQDLVENKLLAAHRNCPGCDKQPRFHVAYEKLRKCIIYQLYQVFIKLDFNGSLCSATQRSNGVYMELLSECLNSHKTECYHFIYELHSWDEIEPKIKEVYPKLEALRDEYVDESNNERVEYQIMMLNQNTAEAYYRKEAQASA